MEGTDLRVLKYPHPALRAKNAEIEVFDDDLKKLAKDMLKVFDAYPRGEWGYYSRLTSWYLLDNMRTYLSHCITA